MQVRQSIMSALGWIGLLAFTGVGMAYAQNPTDPKPAQPADKQKPATPENSGPVVLTVTTDKKTYKDTEPIHITLTAKNTLKTPFTIRFTGQQYDIEIHKGKGGNGEKVWQWSRGRMFMMAITSKVIASDKPLTFKEDYDPANKGYDGKSLKLSAGTYTIVGYLTTIGRTPRPMGSVIIQVQ